MADTLFLQIRNIFLFCAIFYASYSFALLEIVVLKGDKNALPIAILPFKVTGKLEYLVEITEIIRSNLNRSGRFNAPDSPIILSANDTPDTVNFSKWHGQKMEALVLGDIKDSSKNFFEVNVYGYDIYAKERIFASRYIVNKNAKHKIAHKISDKIYEELLGEKGAFDTYLSYVNVTKDNSSKLHYKIEIANTDGKRTQTIFKSTEPLMSPVWSPDNTRIAFVSFQNGYSEIFIKYPFVRRKIKKLPRFDGIASTPAWHPNSEKLALTLSKGGNKDIYIYDLKTKKLNRITMHSAIDTEPAFSPDGKQIAFTSNRSGKAQIYLKNLKTNKIKRISYYGEHNSGANFSPNGRYLTMLSFKNARYHIALFDLINYEWTVMTQNNLDESPYFSPNSGMIVYATNSAGIGVLSVVSIDGLRLHQLSDTLGEVRDPSWSNYLD